MYPYNEALVEGVAVLGYYITTSVTANMTANMRVSPFHMGSFRRIVFDVNNWACQTQTTSTMRFELQGATTAGATYYRITGPDTTYPSLVSGSFTSGDTITATMVTTAVNFVRLEYKAESIRNAIDVYNAGTTSGGTKAGSWLTLALNPTGGVSGTGTFALSIVAYGVGGNAPSADININKWLTNTAVTCNRGQTFIDGWSLTNTSAFATAILPY